MDQSAGLKQGEYQKQVMIVRKSPGGQIIHIHNASSPLAGVGGCPLGVHRVQLSPGYCLTGQKFLVGLTVYRHFIWSGMGKGS